jgi:hypothetical protein
MKYKPGKSTIRTMLLSLVPLAIAIFSYWLAGWHIAQNPILTTPGDQALNEKYFYFSIIASSLFLMPVLSGFMMQLAAAQCRKEYHIHPDSYWEDEERYGSLLVGLFFVFILCLLFPTQFRPVHEIQHYIYKLNELIYGSSTPLDFYSAFAFLLGWFAGVFYVKRQFRRHPYETEPIRNAPTQTELYYAPKPPKRTREKLLVLWMGISLIACMFFFHTGEWHRWPFWICFISLLSSLFFLAKAIKSLIRL